MRDILTILAALVIVALSAALAVPYFVDWDARRADVELALGHALGLPVTTQGDIKLRLLPSPRLVLGKVSFGAPGAGQPGIAADALSVELDATALLTGTIRVVEADLTQPVMTVIAEPDGSLRLPQPRTAIDVPAHTVGIEKMTVNDGRLRIIEGGGGARELGPVTAEVQATTLAGPWRVAGTIGAIPMRLSTGTLDGDGQLQLKASFGQPGSSHLDFDGDVVLASTGQSLKPQVTGRLQLAVPFGGGQATPAAAPAAPGEIQPGLTASATVKSSGGHATLEGIEITNTGDGPGATLAGGGTFDLDQDGPTLALDLDARRLDLGAIDGAAAGMRDLGRMLADTWPGLKASVAVKAASIALAGEEFGPAEAAFRREGDRLAVERFTLGGAGDARFAASGTLGLVGGLDFSGHVQLAVREPARLAPSLARMGAPATLTTALAVLPSSTLAADVAVSPVVFAARNIRFAAGDSRLSGLVRYTPPLGLERARFEAQLAGKGVDLGGLPLFDAGATMLASADVGLAIDIDAPRFGPVPSPGGRLKARITSTSEALTIDGAEMTNVDGANLTLAGRLGREGGQIEGRLTAPRPATIAAMVARFLPEPLAKSLAWVAPQAAPLDLAIRAERRDARAPITATMEGQGADTSFHITARLPSGAASGGADAAAVRAEIQAPDGADLLRQLGADVAPVAGTGPGRLTFDLTGPSLADLRGRGQLTAAGAVVTADGRLDLLQGAGVGGEGMQGRLVLETHDLATPTQVLARSFPGLTPGTPARIAANAAWGAQGLFLKDLSGTVGGSAVSGQLAVGTDGRIDGALSVPRLALAGVVGLSLGPLPPPSKGQIWPSGRFIEAQPPIIGRVALKVGQLDVVNDIALDDSRFTLELAPDGIALRDLAGRLGTGTVTANLKLQRQGTLAALTGNVALAGVSQAVLLGPGFDGTLSGRLEAAGSGESAAGLVTNLAGGGELTADGMRLDHIDPTVLSRVIAQLLAQDQIRADAAFVRDQVAGEIGKAAWPVSRVVAPVTLSGGTARVGPITLEAKGATLRVTGTVDLGSFNVDARGTLAARTAPPGWTGAAPELSLVWRGPLLAPGRSIDAAALANGLAVVGLARELDRIDKLEADAKERAERMRQLRLERERLAAEKRAAEQRDRLDPATTGTTTPGGSQPAPASPPTAPPQDSSAAPTIQPIPPDAQREVYGESRAEAVGQHSVSDHGVRPAPPRSPSPPRSAPRSGAPLDLSPDALAPVR
ncbi:AsmA family protein [Chelatococcus sp. GCM10030263]|uniref:AsmA family protein n=1 Tax=Chelatococcus sp. GCM10030263 TaxID=3273387 RepID=UPI00361806D3